MPCKFFFSSLASGGAYLILTNKSLAARVEGFCYYIYSSDRKYKKIKKILVRKWGGILYAMRVTEKNGAPENLFKDIHCRMEYFSSAWIVLFSVICWARILTGRRYGGKTIFLGS